METSATATNDVPVVRVLVVEHHRFLAEALASRLHLEADLDVVAAVDRASQALAIVPQHGVQVVVAGDWLGDDEGVELVRQLNDLPVPPRVVLLGAAETPGDITGALAAGAHAWVGQECPVEVLLQAIRAVARGQMWLPPTALGPVMNLLLTGERSPETSGLELLTSREIDVLRCMVEGLGQADIARRLWVSPNTVRTHRRRALAKLGVHSSLAAVAAARRAGLTPAAAG